MRSIARISPLERAELFKNTAYKMGLPEAIIEKDFIDCTIGGIERLLFV